MKKMRKNYLFSKDQQIQSEIEMKRKKKNIIEKNNQK